jgi:hypothetical protein
MKNILKTLFIQLSYNATLKEIAKKVLKRFTLLKSKLQKLRNTSYVADSSNNIQNIYKSDFLDNIKIEIEKRKDTK